MTFRDSISHVFSLLVILKFLVNGTPPSDQQQTEEKKAADAQRIVGERASLTTTLHKHQEGQIIFKRVLKHWQQSLVKGTLLGWNTSHAYTVSGDLQAGLQLIGIAIYTLPIIFPTIFLSRNCTEK